MMKNAFWGLSIYLASLFVIAGVSGCTKEGPMGPAGKDASAGALEGFAEGIKCATCHDSDTDTTYRVLAKEAEYAVSVHAVGGNFDRNTTQCAGCHTNEGFYERYVNGFANETYIPGVSSGQMVSQNYLNSSPPGCFTCHSPHRRANFTVRDSGAVNIYSIVTGQVAKNWNSSPASNLCVKCHQPRMTSTFLTSPPYSWQPDPTKTNLTDTAKIYTTRWNDHVSGEPTQTLLGFGGYEFSGYTYDNSYHTTLVGMKQLGCEDCHMATPSGNHYGGHTFAISYLAEGSTTPSYNVAGCNTASCHNGSVSTGATNIHWGVVRNEIISKISQLGYLMMDTNVTKKWSVPQNGKAVAWTSFTVSGIDTTWSVANASSSAPLVIVPASKAGALWNLQQVMYGKSNGIHNYKYVKALLDASIAELNQ